MTVRERPGGGSVDLSAELADENDRLRLQVARLAARVAEYERTMAHLQASRSWRITTPLRLSAGWVRRARRAARRRVRRLVGRGRGGDSLLGLFGGDPQDSTPRLEPPFPARMAWPRLHRVLVVAHVHYPEAWPDIAERLTRIPEGFDLVVSVTEGAAESVVRPLLSAFPDALVHVTVNRGRDQAPLVLFSSWGLFEGYDAVLKVHTKRSPHRLDGDAWRREMLDGLLPSEEAVGRVLELLRADSGIGIVAPPSHVRGPELWGTNLVPTERLAQRISLGFDPDQLRFPAGSMFWATPWVLDRLGDLGLCLDDFEPEAGHTDASVAHALERFVGLVATRGGLDVIAMNDVPARLHQARSAVVDEPPRTLAFYLPQYHPIAENDIWWGEGFTDWDRVAAARPLFDGHRQPQGLGVLGRYDPTTPEVLAAQGELARSRGIDGLVLYHYWFDGRRLLERPLSTLLANPDIDLPFALCWANESWTRAWDGRDTDVLVEQTYGDDWVDRFYDDSREAWADPRHIRVAGSPLLVIYRLGGMPDAAETIRRWKSRARADGLGGLHVLAMLPGRDFEPTPLDAIDALDGFIEFPPMSATNLVSLTSLAPGLRRDFDGEIWSYDAAADGPAPHVPEHGLGLPIHPGVMPGWDNTPRRDSAAHVFHGANAVSYRRWLRRAEAESRRNPERLVFVNAWNEWAEGAVLER